MAILEVTEETYLVIQETKRVSNHQTQDLAVRAACKHYIQANLAQPMSQKKRLSIILRDAVRRGKLLP